jgi:TonB family protein
MERWWQDIILTGAIKGTAILACAWVCVFALRKSSASTRHFVWAFALAGVLLLPAGSKVAPRWDIPVALESGAVGINGGTSVQRAVPPAFDWSRAAFLLWAAGALLLTIRFMAGGMALRRLRRSARRAPHAEAALAEAMAAVGLRRPVVVYETPRAPVPMAWGLRRPIVVLPGGTATWPIERLHAVLLHELLHIQRLDLAIQFLAHLVCSVYWFHPLVWLAARELAKERERACDDGVINLGLKGSEYAEHLVALARGIRARRSLWAVGMAEASGLEDRVRSALDRSRNRRPLTRGLAAAALCGALAVILPLAGVHAQPQPGKGALAGIVTDPSGAVVPRCSITASHQDGPNQEVTTTNQAGEYRFNAIPAGRYTLEYRAPGFRLGRIEAVVRAGVATRSDATLSLGGVGEAITVTARRTTPAPVAANPPRRIRVGGNVQPPRLVMQRRPAYPESARQLGIEGSVQLRAVISVDGSPMNLEAVNTDVHPDLVQAALDAVKQWRYQPTLLNGQPVEVVTTVTVAFRLED